MCLKYIKENNYINVKRDTSNHIDAISAKTNELQ